MLIETYFLFVTPKFRKTSNIRPETFSFQEKQYIMAIIVMVCLLRQHGRTYKRFSGAV